MSIETHFVVFTCAILFYYTISVSTNINEFTMNERSYANDYQITDFDVTKSISSNWMKNSDINSSVVGD